MAFKDLFFKSEEETQSVETKNTSSNNQPQSVVQPRVSPTLLGQSTEYQVEERPSNTSVSSSITADDNIVNKIWDKIIAANRPGPDYLELKNNVEALEDLPISAEQKLVSAFKVLKKGYPNFQKDDITKAIDFYIKVVDDEKNAGLSELNALIQNNVNSVEDEIKTMQMQAEELKRQYDELQSRIGEKTIELTKAKNDLDMKHNAFIGSVDAVLNVLKNDKENILSINF